METNENDKPRESGEELKLVDSDGRNRLHESTIYGKFGCIMLTIALTALPLIGAAFYWLFMMDNTFKETKYGPLNLKFDKNLINTNSNSGQKQPGTNGK